MKCITVMNQKGGVGKTTTAANLGVALARRGRRMLLVDPDQAHPQRPQSAIADQFPHRRRKPVADRGIDPFQDPHEPADEPLKQEG